MSLPIGFADLFSPDILALFIPIVALMIPIVVTLTKHQQRMAEIIHGNNTVNETNELRREVADLRSIIQSQALALDDVKNRLALQQTYDTDISGRLKSSS